MEQYFPCRQGVISWSCQYISSNLLIRSPSERDYIFLYKCIHLIALYKELFVHVIFPILLSLSWCYSVVVSNFHVFVPNLLFQHSNWHLKYVSKILSWQACKIHEVEALVICFSFFLTGVSNMAFRHLIEFTYTAKLMVQGEEEANDVWKAAEYLQMLEAIKALEIR